MRPEVSYFVNDCSTRQKMERANRIEFSYEISVSNLYHSSFNDFAGPKSIAISGSRYTVIDFEKMSKWQVAKAISTEPYNSLGVIDFFKKRIIMLFDTRYHSF